MNETKINENNPQNLTCNTPETSDIKIGGITYIVASFYKENAKESLKDKLWRLIENDDGN
jgi:hypothetical protein